MSAENTEFLIFARHYKDYLIDREYPMEFLKDLKKMIPVNRKRKLAYYVYIYEEHILTFLAA